MEKNHAKNSHTEKCHVDKERVEKDLRRAVITVVVITAFITTFTGSALNLSIPDIGSQFGASAGRMGWLVSGYTLSVAAFSVPFGRLADITSRRNVLIAGIALFVACCIAALLSGSMAMLLISRVMQGVGAAMIFSTNTAVLISAFPGEQRGRALGYSLASTYVGLSAGPVIGGALNHNFGWRSIFVFIGILGVVALAAALMKLPAEKRTEPHAPGAGRRSFDAAGNVIYMISIFLLMYGLSEAGKNGAVYIAVAAAGAAAGIIFVSHEMKSADPVVDIRLFRENKGYAFSNLSAMLNYGATFAISYLISIYLQVVMGYSSQTAGLIMIFQPLIMALLSPVAGRLSDRFSPFRMSPLGVGAVCRGNVHVHIYGAADASRVHNSSSGSYRSRVRDVLIA
ncbi:MAG: MFS transporter [Clostridia bacterium]